MNKKELLFLLMPSGLFVFAGLMHMLFLPHALNLPRGSDETFEKIAANARSGEVSTDRLVENWHSASDSSFELQAVVKRHMRTLGACILCGAALQIYAVLRVSSQLRRARQSTVPNSPRQPDLVP